MFLLPKKILTLVTSMCRNFLWTGSNEYTRRPPISWDTMCQPRATGGLNIINFFLWNKATIYKLLWPVAKKKEKLRVLWVHTYYIKNVEWSSVDTPKQDSWLIRKVFDARNWLDADVNPNLAIDSFTVQGKFSIKKVYKDMLPRYPRTEWKKLYLVKGMLPRHQFVLWLALHKRLSTMDRLSSWGIQVPVECVLCGTTAMETHDHLYFGCAYSKGIWQQLVKWTGIQAGGRLAQEVHWVNSQVRHNRAKGDLIAFIFAAAVYQMWMERNGRRFQQRSRDATLIVKDIIMQVFIKGQRIVH
ncbi:uncharacterized protein LOC132057872 [Lycium ferocissimum]|uniref:uncharacterized protein LOC132057872 n=1 Tax=Lycium ferocissimum TaxID=112874 RepID=UPI002815756E|nr:uncharacterized protein LOC132057872 [Lycium ferocissimum]